MSKEIVDGFHQTPLGPCYVALLEGKICRLSFPDAGDEAERAILKGQFPDATFTRRQSVTKEYALLAAKNARFGVGFKLVGTPFQERVWKELQKIPAGQTLTYQQLANRIRKPKAVRAVANAVGANPVAVGIPCHRVLRKNGELGGYRWGTWRKEALLEKEGIEVIR